MGLAFFVDDMFDHFGAEMLEYREDGAWSRLAQGAERTFLDGAGEGFEGVERFHRGLAFDDEVEQVEHLLGAFAAKHAFAARFVLRELHEEPGDLDHAGLFVHHDETAGTDHGPHLAQVVKIHRQVEVFLGQATAGGTADLYGLEAVLAEFAVVIGHAFAHAEHDFAQRRAERHLDKARVLHVSRQRKRLCARA